MVYSPMVKCHRTKPLAVVMTHLIRFLARLALANMFVKKILFHNRIFFFRLNITLCIKVPRTVFVDLEPTVIDEIRTGTYRQLVTILELNKETLVKV
jgi:hypothetical protein